MDITAELIAALENANAEAIAWRTGVNHRNINRAKVGAIYTNYDDTRRLIARAKASPPLTSLPAIAALVGYAAAAPAGNPGEGHWSSIEAAFGCGERAAQYEAATRIREALAALGLAAPAGKPVCDSCGCDLEWGDHDPDCDRRDEEDCATCAASAETRLLPCDECGALDEEDGEEECGQCGGTGETQSASSLETEPCPVCDGTGSLTN